MANFSPDTLQAARDAGYTDDQIYDHLSQTDPRFDTARQSGYKLDDVAAHFAAKSAPSLPTQVVQSGEVAPPDISGIQAATQYGQQQGAPDIQEQRKAIEDLPPVVRNPLEAASETALGLIPKSVGEVGGLAASFVPPVQGIQDIGRGATMLKDVLFGKPIDEATAQAFPETQVLPQAEQTAPFSKERYRAGFDTLAQLGMAAAVGRGIPTKPPTLTETLGLSEKQPEVVQAANDALTELESKYAPPEPVPAATEATTNVLGKQEPVAQTTAAGTGEGGGFMPPIVTEMFSTLRQSVDNLTSRISDVKWGKYSEGDKYNKIQFKLDGVTHEAELKGRNKDFVLSDNPEVNKALATRTILDEHAVKTGNETPVQEAPVSTTGSGIQETAAPLSTETPANQIRKAVDSYDFDEQHAGHGQLAQDLEQIDNLPKPLAKALEDYRDAVEEDRTQYGERSGEPAIYGDRLYKAATEHAAPETRTEGVAPKIPEGAKATVKVKDTRGNTVDVPNVDAKEWADKFTKERDSYKALIDCLGR